MITEDRPGALGQACGVAITAQFVAMLLVSLIYHDGFLFTSCAICILGHWLTVLTIWIRRGKNPTKVDLAMVRSGFILYWGALFLGLLIYGLAAG